MGSYVRRGAAAGFAAGVCLAVILRVLGEPWIDAAVRFEKANQSGSTRADMFSRSTQHLGGMIGAGLYGLAVGVVFSVVFATIRHHVPGPDWRRAGRLAAAGFVSLFLVPFLKYPANPPSVGDPGTVTRRTMLYLLLVGWSVVAMWAAWRLHRELVTRGVTDYVRGTVTTVYGVTSVGVAYLIFPPYTDAVAPRANLIWHFRLASVAGQLVYWAVLGAAFGVLCLRASRRHAEPVNAPVRHAG